MPEKLVRDLLPLRYGVEPRVVAGDELRGFFVDKIREEVDELIEKLEAEDMTWEQVAREALWEVVDLLDAIDGVCNLLRFDPGHVDRARWHKRVDKGAFAMGYVIDVPAELEDRA